MLILIVNVFQVVPVVAGIKTMFHLYLMKFVCVMPVV